MNENYSAVAAEYYDHKLHPTCYDFCRFSRFYLESMLAPDDVARPILEVGAGDSVVASILNGRNQTLHGLEITDASKQMLAYSTKWSSLGAQLRVAPADELDRPDRSTALIIASLCDPYNTPKFWIEAARVLEEGGRIIATIPSYRWATRYRGDRHISTAEFVLTNGQKVRLPSFIFDLRSQLDIFESAGLHLINFFDVGPAESGLEITSPKLNAPDETNLSVIWGFSVKKNTNGIIS